MTWSPCLFTINETRKVVICEHDVFDETVFINITAGCCKRQHHLRLVGIQAQSDVQSWAEFLALWSFFWGCFKMTQTRAHHLLSQYCCAWNYLVPRLIAATFKLVFLSEISSWFGHVILSCKSRDTLCLSLQSCHFFLLYNVYYFAIELVAYCIDLRYGLQSLTSELWCQICTVYHANCGANNYKRVCGRT